MRKRSIKLAILFLIAGSLYLDAQIIRTKLDVVAGFSFREYLHAGLRYQYTDITQLGLFIGTDGGIYPEIANTYSIDHLIHFGKTSFTVQMGGYFWQKAKFFQSVYHRFGLKYQFAEHWIFG